MLSKTNHYLQSTVHPQKGWVLNPCPEKFDTINKSKNNKVFNKNTEYSQVLSILVKHFHVQKLKIYTM